MKAKTLREWRIAKHHEAVQHPIFNNVPMAVFIFSNSLVGGIIILPNTLKQSGFGLGILLLVVMAALQDYTLQLVIHAARISKSTSYPHLMKNAYGKGGYFITSFLIAAFAFTGLIGGNLLVRDMGVKLVRLILGRFANVGVYGDPLFIIGVANAAFFLPLSMLRNIALLSQVSVASIVTDFLYIAFFAIRLGTLDLPQTPDAFTFARFNVVDAAGLLFTTHPSAFIVYNSLAVKSDKNWRTITNYSIVIALATFLLTGILGFVTFTGNTRGDIFDNYCDDDILMSIGRALFLLSILLTYPIAVFVIREIVEETVFPRVRTRPENYPLYIHIPLTVVIVGGAMGISFWVSCLSLVSEITGFLAGTPIALIFPPLAVLRLEKRPLKSKENIPIIFVLIIGIVGTSLGLVISIFNILEGQGCPPALGEPEFCNSTISLTTIGP